MSNCYYYDHDHAIHVNVGVALLIAQSVRVHQRMMIRQMIHLDSFPKPLLLLMDAPEPPTRLTLPSPGPEIVLF